MFELFVFGSEHQVAMSVTDALFDWKSNVLNWLILVGGIVWFAQKNLPSMFASREQSIQESLNAAATSRQEAQQFLQEQKGRVANAEKEASQILSEAKQVAEQMKTQIQEQTKKDLVDLENKFEGAIENERRVLVTEMRAAAAKAAVELSEAYLAGAVNQEVKGKLLNQFMEQLDTVNSNEKRLAAGDLSRSGERR